MGIIVGKNKSFYTQVIEAPKSRILLMVDGRDLRGVFPYTSARAAHCPLLTFDRLCLTACVSMTTILHVEPKQPLPPGGKIGSGIRQYYRQCVT